MIILARFLLFFVMLVVSANGAIRFVQLASELRLPLPENWTAPPDSASYPFRLWHQSANAELLIFRSEIEPDELISSDQNLEQAVQSIVDDVILSLPGAKLITSTGYYNRERCGFVLEFLSVDSAAEVELRHRLSGTIYRRPEGGQYLFTLWGKAPVDQFRFVTNDIQLMQTEFSFFGEFAEDVYSGSEPLRWPTYAGLALLSALIFALWRVPSRKRKLERPEPDLFWRCPCGKPNPSNLIACPFCATRRTGETVR